METPAPTGKKVTIVGVLVNTFLILLKLATGIFGSSQALIADAVHSFSDLFTDVVVLVGLKISHKPPNKLTTSYYDACQSSSVVMSIAACIER